MSGETQEHESGWTVDTLRAHYDQRFADLTTRLDERFEASDQAVTTALTAAEKATLKAELAADKRFDSVNEFRAQLADQAATFFPRAEAESRIASLAEKIDDLARRLDKSEGRGLGLANGWAILIGVVGLALSLFLFYNLLHA